MAEEIPFSYVVVEFKKIQDLNESVIQNLRKKNEDLIKKEGFGLDIRKLHDDRKAQIEDEDLKLQNLNLHKEREDLKLQNLNLHKELEDLAWHKERALGMTFGVGVAVGALALGTLYLFELSMAFGVGVAVGALALGTLDLFKFKH
ncbi:uncharacterized protein LOC141830361 [Curcuma longa]|uniref:uncharacterized protein LOC141830361 n=1 Tax=Curcuma longa TaxID=136217 RepID=UPI003D9F0019